MSFMSFPQGPRRGARPARARGPVFAVGQRVRVQLTERDHASVTLNDEAGGRVGSLANGEEVEIVGWRPSGSDGARYQVCARDRGLEGWLGAVCLRDPAATAAPRVAAPPERVDSDASAVPGRRFGQR